MTAQRKAKSFPPLKDLQYHLEYDPLTGDFTIIRPMAFRNKVGDIAGNWKASKWVINFRGVRYYAEELAWYMFYRKEPTSAIRHKNGDPGDNRIKNLVQELNVAKSNGGRPSQDYLLQKFDIKNWHLYAKMRRSNKVNGSLAEFKHHTGGLIVNLDNRQYPAHYLIFCMVNGYYPHKIFHKDGDYTNNNPNNLIEITEMKDRNDLTQEQLKKLIWYNPKTGRVFWRIHYKDLYGKRADFIHPDNGYDYVNLLGRQYRVGRLAWLYEYGVWPIGEIDHKNRNKNDNRIVNLRDATTQQNNWNKEKMRARKKLPKGVYPNPAGTFRARIWDEESGKNIEIGTFKSIEAAEKAYLRAHRRIAANYSYK